MNNHGGSKIDQGFPESFKIRTGVRVDDGDFIFRGYLNKTQLGAVRILGDKLGIKSDKLLGSYLVAKLME